MNDLNIYVNYRNFYLKSLVISAIFFVIKIAKIYKLLLLYFIEYYGIHNLNIEYINFKIY